MIRWRTIAQRRVLAATQDRGDDGSAAGVRDAVFLRELMHAIGIAHVHDVRSIMYPVMRSWRLSAGDRAALAWAGRG